MHITGIGFSAFRGRGRKADGAQPLTFEGGWKAEQAPLGVGGGGYGQKRKAFSCALKV